MQCILSLFKKTKKEYSLKDFNGAGCIFTDGTHILAGYQKGKISGIGGTRIKDENYMQTALREFIEEIFEYKPTPDLLFQLEHAIEPQRVFINSSYVCVQYSFEDLEVFMLIVKLSEIYSVLYDESPVTVSDLIFNRKCIAVSNQEVFELCLLPLRQGCQIDKNFIKDIEHILS
jgi:hypothetical protein